MNGKKDFNFLMQYVKHSRRDSPGEVKDLLEINELKQVKIFRVALCCCRHRRDNGLSNMDRKGSTFLSTANSMPKLLFLHICSSSHIKLY
jgi:hypothetical protein